MLEQFLSEKKLVGKTNFVRKNLLGKILSEKKIMGNFFYQKVVGVTSMTEFALLSTEWVDYVEEPMKNQTKGPHFFSMGGWCGWCTGKEWDEW